MLLMLAMTPALKKFQGRRPQRRKRGYFSIWLLGHITVKTNVKTNIMPSGLRRLHRKPSALLL